MSLTASAYKEHMPQCRQYHRRGPQWYCCPTMHPSPAAELAMKRLEARITHRHDLSSRFLVRAALREAFSTFSSSSDHPLEMSLGLMVSHSSSYSYEQRAASRRACKWSWRLASCGPKGMEKLAAGSRLAARCCTCSGFPFSHEAVLNQY